MKRHAVTQQISFCYGHRLMNYDGKCAHPHGHNGIAEITFESDGLDSRGMVIDFTDIKKVLKSWIDEALDHQMLLRKDDPLLGVLKEMKEPVFEFDENPTAENIARVIFEHAQKQKLPVTEVKLWETATQFAVYRSEK